MTFFEYHNAGSDERAQMQATAFLLAQDSVGKARSGVLIGLGVTQTPTMSGTVNVGAGAAVVQAATLDGASLVGDVQDTPIDIFGPSPMGGNPRTDIIVADRATGSIRAIIGVASAIPADPAVPSSAIPLAKLHHVAGATSIPTSAIEDMRVYTTLAQAPAPAWVPYNPVWSDGGGVALDVKSGSVKGQTLDTGKQRRVRIELLRGADSNLGTKDYWFTYPTAGVDTSWQVIGTAWYFRTSGGGNYGGIVRGIAAGQVAVITDGGLTLLGAGTFTGTTPWGAGGRITIDFTVPLL
ncbi:hypothetical protein GCM10009740_31370 [Terrabacter terrae]|uniref:Minor tail protein n=1 Tax=Terrabacter terrae TaxID=318434 RepID=A0ABP5G429_9MICO